MKGVIVHGCDVKEVELSAADEATMRRPTDSQAFDMVERWEYKPLPGKWMGCIVQKLLGVHLALAFVDRSLRTENESVAILMLIDQQTGLAPMDFQAYGMGLVKMARTDGLDLTVKTVYDLHSYISHLMDLWGDFDPRNPADLREIKRLLTPKAYQQFLRQTNRISTP